MPPPTSIPAMVSLLAFQLGANQLNTFETFLTNAVQGIDHTGVIHGMLNVCWVILGIGFLWELYVAAFSGGDMKQFGKVAAKFVVTSIVVQSWPDVFTAINKGFVDSGSWMTHQGGVGNVLDGWADKLKGAYNNGASFHLWGLVTGELAALLDAVVVMVAYLLYPFVTAIFGFFYIMMGSILFITGPLVISLMPFQFANRLAKSYVENVFIWNAWPILYGALGLLITAVHLGDYSATGPTQNFLGTFSGLEGTLLLGLISLVYSVGIAVIPFMAKAIVSGEVGAAAQQLLNAATTAVSAGVGAFAGAEAGIVAARSGSSPATPTSPGNVPAKTPPAPGGGGGNNQPAATQPNAPGGTGKQNQAAKVNGGGGGGTTNEPATAQPGEEGTTPSATATEAGGTGNQAAEAAGQGTGAAAEAGAEAGGGGAPEQGGPDAANQA